jgi:hypothetical protein
MSREEVKEEMKKDAAELPDDVSKALEAVEIVGEGVEGISDVIDAYVNDEGDFSDVIEAYGKGAGEVAYYGAKAGRGVLKDAFRSVKGTCRHKSVHDVLGNSNISEEDKAELKGMLEEMGLPLEVETQVKGSRMGIDGSIEGGQLKAEMHVDRRGFEGSVSGGALGEIDSYGVELKLDNNSIGGTYTRDEYGEDSKQTYSFEFGRNKFAYTRTEEYDNGDKETYKEKIKFKKNGGAVVKTTESDVERGDREFGPAKDVWTTKYKIKPDGKVTVKEINRYSGVEVCDNGYFEYGVYEGGVYRDKYEDELSPEDMASLQQKPKLSPEQMRLLAEKLKER